MQRTLKVGMRQNLDIYKSDNFKRTATQLNE
jgi:hypothetical protein